MESVLSLVSHQEGFPNPLCVSLLPFMWHFCTSKGLEGDVRMVFLLCTSMMLLLCTSGTSMVYLVCIFTWVGCLNLLSAHHSYNLPLCVVGQHPYDQSLISQYTFLLNLFPFLSSACFRQLNYLPFPFCPVMFTLPKSAV